MSRSLFNRSWRNVFFSGGAYLIPLFLFLVTTPYIVSKLGVVLYGTLIILQTLEDILEMSDLGLTPTIIKYVAEYKAQEDEPRINSVMGLAITYYAIVGLISSAFIVVFANWITTAFGISNVYDQRLGLVLVLVAFDSFIQIMSLAPRAVPAAVQRFDWLASLELTCRILGTCLTVLLLVLGGGLLEVVAGALSITVVRAIALFAVAHRLEPKLSFRPAFNLQTLRTIFPFGFYNAGLFLSGRFVGFGDRFSIGLILGPQATSFYSVADRFAIQIQYLISESLRFLFPLTSSLTTLKQDERLYRIFLFVSKITALCTVALAFPIMAGSFKLTLVWLGDAFARNSSMILLIQACVYGIMANLQPVYFLLNGSGRAKVLGLWFPSGAILLLGLYLIFIPQLGLMGAAMSNLAYALSNLLVYLLIIYPYIMRRPLSEILRSYLPAVITLVLFVPIEAMFHILSQMPNLPLMLLAMAGYGTLILIIGLLADSIFSQPDSILSILFRVKNSMTR